MVRPDSSIRSAARATFSAYRSLPIRWRLAGGSAVLTLIILAGFAAIVGVLTTQQVQGQFNDGVASAADQLQRQLSHHLRASGGILLCNRTVHLSDYASAEQAQIRIFDQSGGLQCTQSEVKIKGERTPPPDRPVFSAPGSGTFEELGYRVEARTLAVYPRGQATLLYARPLSDV